MDETYLDNAATSWPKPEEVYRAVEHYMRRCGGTPARGRHPRAVEAGQTLSECRSRLERLLGAGPGYHLAFTSGATEALNLALQGWLDSGEHVVVTELEHNSVLRPLSSMKRSLGLDWTVVPAREDGTVDPEEVRRAIRPTTRLVVVSHASNVLGTPVDIAAVVEVAHQSRVPVLVDAAQTVGVLPIDVSGAHIDMLAFTGHKSLLGPSGIGGLVFREDFDLAPLKEGGTGTFSEQTEQPSRFPDRYESGSPNMVGIAGLAAGLAHLQHMGLESVRSRKAGLVAFLRDELKRVPGVRLYGSSDPRGSVGILSFNLGSRPSDQVADALWERGGFMVRSGLHCAPLIHRRLGTETQGTVRVGVGLSTTYAQLEALAATLRKID